MSQVPPAGNQPQTQIDPADQALLDAQAKQDRQSFARSMALMQIQQQAQQDNQMISTLSNLMKVRHDTNKAVINNFRVG